MVLTPDAANKMLRNLEEQKKILNQKMSNYSTFVVAVTEGDPEQLKPDFDFNKTVEEINEINQKIMLIKHARNVFNAETIVPVVNLSIDMALVKIGMLQKEYERYRSMGNVQPKERVRTGLQQTKDIEYRYTNYDINYAKSLSEKVFAEISEIQTQLDLVNATKTFIVEI